MTELAIHNSLTRRKERFEPIEAGKVRMYVCGVTVYDFCHVGHARCYIVFDTIVRYLRARGFDVEYVRNITDIDDKIIQRAAENDEDIDTLTERFIAAMYEDFDALAIARPDVEPRATEYIDNIIDMIRRLIANDAAYAADNGDVYYNVRSFANYGKLSGKKLDDLRAGARVDVDEAKRDPLDFVLWKAAKPGEPAWDSPWGKGRPGWHIECSAMSEACLGETFDIHGGGMDLKFPHHENEIAQSCRAHGGQFARYWAHNGFVNVNEEKMSKSLGNFFTIREVLKLYSPEVLRFFLISTHYRSPINYSEKNLNQAKHKLGKLYMSLANAKHLYDVAKKEGIIGKEDQSLTRMFYEGMNDDFNTWQAVSVLSTLSFDINQLRNDLVHKGFSKSFNRQLLESLVGRYDQLVRLGGILGVLQNDPSDYLRGRGNNDEVMRIQELIAERNQARKDRNFARADEIRDQLAAEGIQLDDSPEGTTWRKG